MGIIFSFHWITFIIARIFCNTKVVMRANEPRSRCQLLSNTDAWLLLPLFYNNIGNAYIMSGAKITRSSLDHNRSDLYGKRWTILQWYWSKRGHIRTNTCLATHKHNQRVNVDNLNEAREREKEKKLEKFGFHVNHRVEESKSVMIFPYELGYRDFNISRFLAWRMRHGFIVYLFNLFQFFFHRFHWITYQHTLCLCFCDSFFFSRRLLVSSVFFLSDRNKWRVFEFAWIFFPLFT